MEMSSGNHHQNMSNGFFPMMMMHNNHNQHQPPPPPLVPSSPQNPNNGNTLFLSHQEQLNHHGSSPVMLQDNTITSTGYYFMDTNGGSEGGSLKAKIMAHPHYPKLLAAYINCQKIGAPTEVVTKLDEACGSATRAIGRATGFFGEDPALDQFMEAYCEMLTKYEHELAKPFNEAMFFLSRIECQFKAITVSSSAARGEAMEKNRSSEEDLDMNTSFIDPCAEDRELKGQILRKYGGYIGDLKQEFMKKRKKGKLPKEARQQLLEWWSRHYKWPYPSEPQKMALAVSTGLDHKQINNWFINQRKRHWKPSEDMHFMQLEIPHYFLDNAPFPMDISPVLM